MKRRQVQRDAAAPAYSIQELTGHNNPAALSTMTTQAEVTLLPAVGDDFMTLVTPPDANT